MTTIKKNRIIKGDDELCLLIGENNPAAFDYLYLNYSCILYGAAIRAMGSDKYAEEIVEETFVKAWRCVEEFKSQKSPMKLWMIKLMIASIKELLTLKNIQYHLITKHFPEIRFEIILETEKLQDVSRCELSPV